MIKRDYKPDFIMLPEDTGRKVLYVNRGESIQEVTQTEINVWNGDQTVTFLKYEWIETNQMLKGEEDEADTKD